MMTEPLAKQPMTPLPTGLSPKGGLTPPVDCLLCDIYGTLFVSGSGDIGTSRLKTTEHQGLSALLARYHIDLSPTDLTTALHTAIRNEHNRARKSGVDAPEVEIDKIWAGILPIEKPDVIRAFAMAYEMTMNPVWPMPGLKSLIGHCRNYGITLGIISNAQFYTPRLFDHFLGQDLQSLGFDPGLTFLSYQYGWAKPSRYLFQLAVEKLNKMGFSMERVAYIGNDMRNDIAPSQAVGFQTILFAGDARSLRMREDDATCGHLHPDLRITHLEQLPSYLMQH